MDRSDARLHLEDRRVFQCVVPHRHSDVVTSNSWPQRQWVAKKRPPFRGATPAD